eukprot:763929-Hanusia_phi.AAC.11
MISVLPAAAVVGELSEVEEVELVHEARPDASSSLRVQLAADQIVQALQVLGVLRDPHLHLALPCAALGGGGGVEEWGGLPFVPAPPMDADEEGVVEHILLREEASIEFDLRLELLREEGGDAKMPPRLDEIDVAVHQPRRPPPLAHRPLEGASFEVEALVDREARVEDVGEHDEVVPDPLVHKVELPEDAHQQRIRVLLHVLVVGRQHGTHRVTLLPAHRLDHELPVMGVVEQAPAPPLAHPLRHIPHIPQQQPPDHLLDPQRRQERVVADSEGLADVAVQRSTIGGDGGVGPQPLRTLERPRETFVVVAGPEEAGDLIRGRLHFCFVPPLLRQAPEACQQLPQHPAPLSFSFLARGCHAHPIHTSDALPHLLPLLPLLLLLRLNCALLCPFHLFPWLLLISLHGRRRHEALQHHSLQRLQRRLVAGRFRPAVSKLGDAGLLSEVELNLGLDGNLKPEHESQDEIALPLLHHDGLPHPQRYSSRLEQIHVQPLPFLPVPPVVTLPVRLVHTMHETHHVGASQTAHPVFIPRHLHFVLLMRKPLGARVLPRSGGGGG